MNTYLKFYPNVFVAKCEEQHEKGSEIILTTKYGKEHECTIFNYLGKTKDGFYLYSIIRSDGFNAQERAKNKADKLNGYANNAEKRSNEAFKKADLSEEATGIPFGQPILVGHHSEGKHRKVLERADNTIRKSITEDEKTKNYLRRARYWENKANAINLSMPESIEFYECKLHKEKETHQYLKDNPDKRPHSMALQYASKNVKETENNLKMAVKLWGNEEKIQQLKNEEKTIKKTKAEKLSKKSNINTLIEQYGGFWFFGNNIDEFKTKYNKLLHDGYLEEGEKVCHVIFGLYVPVKNKDIFIKSIK